MREDEGTKGIDRGREYIEVIWHKWMRDDQRRSEGEEKMSRKWGQWRQNVKMRGGK